MGVAGFHHDQNATFQGQLRTLRTADWIVSTEDLPAMEPMVLTGTTYGIVTEHGVFIEVCSHFVAHAD